MKTFKSSYKHQERFPTKNGIEDFDENQAFASLNCARCWSINDCTNVLGLPISLGHPLPLIVAVKLARIFFTARAKDKCCANLIAPKQPDPKSIGPQESRSWPQDGTNVTITKGVKYFGNPFCPVSKKLELQNRSLLLAAALIFLLFKIVLAFFSWISCDCKAYAAWYLHRFTTSLARQVDSVCKKIKLDLWGGRSTPPKERSSVEE